MFVCRVSQFPLPLSLPPKIQASLSGSIVREVRFNPSDSSAALTLLAGERGASGYSNEGLGLFQSPIGITVGPEGEIYVGEREISSSVGKVRKIVRPASGGGVAVSLVCGSDEGGGEDSDEDSPFRGLSGLAWNAASCELLVAFGSSWADDDDDDEETRGVGGILAFA